MKTTKASISVFLLCFLILGNINTVEAKVECTKGNSDYSIDFAMLKEVAPQASDRVGQFGAEKKQIGTLNIYKTLGDKVILHKTLDAQALYEDAYAVIWAEDKKGDQYKVDINFSEKDDSHLYFLDGSDEHNPSFRTLLKRCTGR